jgi:uncharacterized protein DUF6590
VAKNSVVKCQHAIAYSDKKEPSPTNAEYPNEGESGMMPGIRIVPTDKRDKLDPMSRIDFARMYTVEHNVKAYDFGKVHENYQRRLLKQWIQTTIGNNKGIELSGFLSGIPDPGPDSDDEDEEDVDPRLRPKASSANSKSRTSKDKGRSSKESKSSKDKSRDYEGKKDKGKGRRGLF